MSQTIKHYQTSFVITGPGLTGEEKLYQAQRVVADWVKVHERFRFRRMGHDKTSSFLLSGRFFTRESYRSKYSWCKTDYCRMDGSLAWAVKYTHRDENVRDVYWISDIGFRSFNATGRLIASVQISYEISTENALMGERYEPPSAIPRCVRNIVERFKGYQFLSGGQDVTKCIAHARRISTLEQSEEVDAYIRSTDRKQAVVLLCGETDRVRKEENFLAKNLFGKALVYVLPYDLQWKKPLARLNLQFEECIFIPSFLVHTRELGSKLRYSVVNQDEVGEKRKSILRAWLGVHSINEQGAVSNVENVRYLIQRQKLFKLSELLKQSVPADKYGQIQSELKDVTDLLEMSDQEKEGLEAEKKTLEGRVDELEFKNLGLEDKIDQKDKEHRTAIHNLQAKNESLGRKSSDNEFQLPRGYPNSFQNLQKFVPFYNHLAFAEDAWEPAFAYARFKDFDVAWEMLYDLDRKLWELAFVKHGDIEREFENATGYQYAKGEGIQTTNDARLARLRKFVFEGKEYDMSPHLKYGNKPGKQLRIHFAFDNDRRRIIVGYIGEHMDNATTRTMH